MPVYLDCAATTPVDPSVFDVVAHYLRDDFGNSGSRTHAFGLTARRAVERARDQVASVVGASRGDVIFTSGATESNNLALLGLAEHGLKTGRTHIISTRVEHRAVLEPLEALERRGFTVQLLPPASGGRIDHNAVLDAVTGRTLLVSMMHVNNETGVLHPVREVAELLRDQPVYLHVDAAQGFAKDVESLLHEGIDLISVSAHKICGPKGVGALIAHRRGVVRPPLEPLLFGGGQERGLRPGTLPVHLIAGFGEAAELWSLAADERRKCGLLFRRRLLDGLAPLNPMVHGDLDCSLPFILNVSIPGFDSETVMEAWGDLVAVSSGAACSAQTYTCSHVLGAMGVSPEEAGGAIRFSWCHLTPMPDTRAMVDALQGLRQELS